MKHLTLTSIVVIIAISLQSCATIFSGTKDQITFKSNPPNATVLMDGKEIGKTDNSILIRRKDAGSLITYRLDGYQDLSFKYEKKIAGAYWIGCGSAIFLLIPGIISITVDLITGAHTKPRTDYYEKTLIPIIK